MNINPAWGKTKSRFPWIKKKRRLRGFPLPFATWSALPLGDLKFGWFIIQFLPSPLSSVNPPALAQFSAWMQSSFPFDVTASGWPDLPQESLAYHMTADGDAGQHICLYSISIWGQERDDAEPRDHLAAKCPSPSRRLTPLWPHQLSTGNNTYASRCHGLMTQREEGGGGSRPSCRTFAKEGASSFLLASGLSSCVDSLVCLCVCSLSIYVRLSLLTPFFIHSLLCLHF